MPTNLLHHGPQNRIQKTSRNMAARKGPRLYKKQSGTHREKKHVLTLTLMLVRRKSACKTSAGSSKILRWLTPLLGPNLDPKTGPKQRPKRRNENVIQFWTPFLGSIFGPKNGVSHRRISLLPAHVVQADLRPCSLNMYVNSYLFLFVRPKSGCYCQGPLVPFSQPCFDHFYGPCFRGHDEAGLLAFEALQGLPRLARGTRTKRGSRGLESI